MIWTYTTLCITSGCQAVKINTRSPHWGACVTDQGTGVCFLRRKSMSTCTYRGVKYQVEQHLMDGATLHYLESERRRLIRQNKELLRDSKMNAGQETIV